MKIGIHKYKCVKCDALVVFDYFPDVRTGETNKTLEKMYDNKVCCDCVEEINNA